MERRSFIQKLTGAAACTLGSPALGKKSNIPQRLILIQLQGGNDGLNTVVPHKQELYYRLRPNLAIPEKELITLNDELGLNPALKALADPWNDGELAIVNGLGYPQPSFSHFTSTDIWESASGSADLRDQGWLTRVFHGKNLVSHGLIIGDYSLGPLAGDSSVLIIPQPRKKFFRQPHRSITMKTNNEALAHIMSVKDQYQQSIGKLFPLADKSTKGNRPSSRLIRTIDLGLTAIASVPELPVIKLSLGSFDTHIRQRKNHDRLLQQLAEGMTYLRSHLKKLGLWESSLVVTYSEFGRRPKENQAQGTDHGSASCQFVMGGPVKGGIYGNYPQLDKLHDDNLVFTTDYRRLYATIIRRLWGEPYQSVLGSYQPLDFLPISRSG